MTEEPTIVSRDEWLTARKQLLAREKEFTRLRDQLSAERRRMPWVRLDKKYVFDGAGGKETLADLFGDKSQLVIYHFMFAPDWEAGCKICSFWADSFNGVTAHLAARDVAFAAVSGASDFNKDFHVSFAPEELANGTAEYNFDTLRATEGEWPGISAFTKDASGTVYHTYSCHSRGIDLMNAAYNYLDLVPKGRDEDALSFSMAWVKHRDRHADQ